MLVNNAAVLLTEKHLTPDGVELQFATNYLGHFALSLGLHARLPRPVTPALCG